MSRERNKPEKSWIEKTREELANQEEFTIERAYEVGKIRGQKETIDKAYKWLKPRLQPYELEKFKRFMEE